MDHSHCKLCLTCAADKKNSHIIPKFMCRGLFESTQPRHAIIIDRVGKDRKVQDTPKEDFILCKSCEKRIEVLETYCARIIRDIHDYKKFSDKFELLQLGGQEFLLCNDVHPTLFRLFIYSLVWRVSISQLPEFSSFNLDKQNEEKIRVFLNSNLTTSKTSLLENIHSMNNIPLYHNCIMKPKVKSPSSRGIFTVCSASTTHVLFLVDFAVFFYTDELSIGNILRKFSNKQNKKLIITLGETDAWLDLNRSLASKMFTTKE